MSLQYLLEKYPKHIHTVDPRSWAHNFYNAAWNDKLGTKTFSEHVVKRDPHETRIPLDIPEKCCVLNGSAGRWFQFFAVTDVLVRDEYITVIRDIIEFMNTDKWNFPVDVDNPSGSATQGSDENNPSSVPFNNPFFETPLVPGLQRKDVIITGGFGIGKALFLYVLLALRLNAGLPTLFQYEPRELVLFTEHGPFKITDPANFVSESAYQIGNAFPTAWCLVDSDSHDMELPFLVQATGLPIIQATSAHWKKHKWQNKRHHPGMVYYMKPWDLRDLILGRELQGPWRQHSEKQLQYWHERYAPSAQLAYKYAHDVDHYEVQLNQRLAYLPVSKLIDLAHKAVAQELDGISDEIIIYPPGPTRTRATPTIPTRHLCDLQTAALSDLMKHSAAEVYRAFLAIPRVASPEGYLVEKMILALLPQLDVQDDLF